MDQNIREANEMIEDLALADLNEEFVDELRDSLVSFLDDGILLDAHADDNEEVVNVHLIHEMGIYRVEYQKDDGAWFTHFIGRDMCEHAANVWTNGTDLGDTLADDLGDTLAADDVGYTLADNVGDTLADDVLVDDVQMSVAQNPISPDSAVVLFSKGDVEEGSVIDQYEFELCEAYRVMKDFVDRVEELPDGSIRWKYDVVPVDSIYSEEQYLQ